MESPTGWDESADIVRLAQRADKCTVLGPGVRAVLWLQGCPMRCPGCISPEMQPFEGGTGVPIGRLAAELAGLSGIKGVTVSGGEPMAQAAAVAALIDQVRSHRDLSFFCYTGHTLARLKAEGTPAQRRLLDRLDVLVDGPYVRERHTDLRWRGSDNQQVHLLSGRYRHLGPLLSDRGRWMELELAGPGGLRWMGIPPPGFQEGLAGKLQQLGISLAGRGVA